MKTYKGMTRQELLTKIIDARVEQAKEYNFKKFGNNDLPRNNESRSNWAKLYKTYPITSKTTPMFSLSAEYDTLCAKGV